MTECLVQNKYLKEISLYYDSIIFNKLGKILMYNYNSKLSNFDSPPKTAEALIRLKLDEIVFRNRKLHHYIFYNFHFFDLIFVFNKENEGKRKIDFL
jgi:hypothetical protein